MARSSAVGRVAVGLTSTAVFAWLAVRRVDFAVTATSLRSASAPLLALGAAALVTTYVAFALRSRSLLRDTAGVSTADAFSYIMIGYLANTVMPLRLGDVVRTILLARRLSTSAMRVGATVMLERTFDILVLLAIAGVVAFVVPIPPVARSSFLLFAAAGAAAVGGLVALVRHADDFWGVLGRLPLLGARLHVLKSPLSRFATGLGTLTSGPRTVAALALSLLAWLVAGCAMAAFVRAFHLPAPWYAGFLVLVVVNLGSTIPSSPGFVGVYHFLAVFALSSWVSDRSSALAFAIVTHAINIVLILTLGLASLARQGIDWQALRASRAMPRAGARAPML